MTFTPHPRTVSDLDLGPLGHVTRTAARRLSEHAHAALGALDRADGTDTAAARVALLTRDVQTNLDTLATLARAGDPYNEVERNYSRLADLVAVADHNDLAARGRLDRAEASRTCQRAVAHQVLADNAGITPALVPETVGYGMLGMSAAPLRGSRYRSTRSVPTSK